MNNIGDGRDKQVAIGDRKIDYGFPDIKQTAASEIKAKDEPL